MRKQLLVIFFAIAFLPTISLAQYSNSSLNGPWMISAKDVIYIIFGGNGVVSEMGFSMDSLHPAGTYNVTSGGAVTGTLYLTDTVHTISGNMLSADAFSFLLDGQGSSISATRVTNPGSLADTLIGTVTDSSDLSVYGVKLSVSGSGVVTLDSGSVQGLTGKIFSEQGLFTGYFTTTEPGCHSKQIEMYGTYISNVLQGIVAFGKQGCEVSGSVYFTRKSAVAGINDVADNSSYNVFPNPFTDHLSVKVSEPGLNSEVYLADVTGKEIYSKVLEGEQESTIADLDQLKPGIYILTIRSEKGIAVKRIVKN